MSYIQTLKISAGAAWDGSFKIKVEAWENATAVILIPSNVTL